MKDNSSKQARVKNNHSKQHPEMVEEQHFRKQSGTDREKFKKQSATLKYNKKRRIRIIISDDDSEASQTANSSSDESNVKKTKVGDNLDGKEKAKEQSNTVKDCGGSEWNKICDEDSETVQYADSSSDEPIVKKTKVCNYDPKTVKEKSKSQPKMVRDNGKRNTMSEEDSDATIIADSSEESNAKKSNNFDDSVYDYVVTEEEGETSDFNCNVSVAHCSQLPFKQHSPKRRSKQKPEPKKRLTYVSKSLSKMATPEKIPITRDETRVMSPPSSLDGNYLTASGASSENMLETEDVGNNKSFVSDSSIEEPDIILLTENVSGNIPTDDAICPNNTSASQSRTETCTDSDCTSTCLVEAPHLVSEVVPATSSVESEISFVSQQASNPIMISNVHSIRQSGHFDSQVNSLHFMPPAFPTVSSTAPVPAGGETQQQPSMCVRCYQESAETNVCEFCGIIFMDLDIYTLHKLSHDRENPLKCAGCGKVCESKFQFTSHIFRDPHP